MKDALILEHKTYISDQFLEKNMWINTRKFKGELFQKLKPKSARTYLKFP
jgi:hypothetical protein